MRSIEQRWHEALMHRTQEGILRTLQTAAGKIDFCSNDYLGVSRSASFRDTLSALAQQHVGALAGSGGSRLICGNSPIKEEVETFIAHTHHTETALLLPSGYMANLTLVSALAKRSDTILIDENIHRSIHDGCRLSLATKWKFSHNDCNHLASLLQKAKGQVFIIVESLYSMEGDFAPLADMIELSEKYQAALIVDEAHAMGVFHWGIVFQHNWQQRVTATVVTYGKAMGCYGAAILGSDLLKKYLVNFAAPLIYSTALTDMQALTIKASYEYIAAWPVLRDQLRQNICCFRQHDLSTVSQEGSPVQVMPFQDPLLLDAVTQKLREDNLMVGAIKSPTVKKGGERIRVGIHAFNTKEQIDQLCYLLKFTGND